MLIATYLVSALAAALALWALWFTVADRAVVLRQLVLGAVLEVAMLAQMVVGAVGVVSGHRLVDGVTFWGYQVVALLLLPGAALWAVAERTRWSSAVLLGAALTILVMQARVWQVWSA